VQALLKTIQTNNDPSTLLAYKQVIGKLAVTTTFMVPNKDNIDYLKLVSNFFYELG
jgi:hypothetical protein